MRDAGTVRHGSDLRVPSDADPDAGGQIRRSGNSKCCFDFLGADDDDDFSFVRCFDFIFDVSIAYDSVSIRLDVVFDLVGDTWNGL